MVFNGIAAPTFVSIKDLDVLMSPVFTLFGYISISGERGFAAATSVNNSIPLRNAVYASSTSGLFSFMVDAIVRIPYLIEVRRILTGSFDSIKKRIRFVSFVTTLLAVPIMPGRSMTRPAPSSITMSDSSRVYFFSSSVIISSPFFACLRISLCDTILS